MVVWLNRSFGFYGVELFFALSGFLIGNLLIRVGSALTQPDRLVTFYIRRWFRTLPLFWLFIGFQILLELGLRRHHLSYSEIVQHALFLRNFNALKITFFPESWSLAIEEWFYLLFPALLWLGLRVVSRFNIAFLSVAAIFFLFSTIARMIEAPHAYAHWPDWQRELVILRFDAIDDWGFCRLDLSQLCPSLVSQPMVYCRSQCDYPLCHVRNPLAYHRPSFGMERRFLFRANVSIQSCFSRIRHASACRFFLAVGAGNLRLRRSSPHRSLVICAIPGPLPSFPDRSEVHAREVEQFICSRHRGYVLAICGCYRDQRASLSLL